jgi:hypothetical protein
MIGSSERPGRRVPLVVFKNISRIPLQRVNDIVNFKLQYTHQIHLNQFSASESSTMRESLLPRTGFAQ